LSEFAIESDNSGGGRRKNLGKFVGLLVDLMEESNKLSVFGMKGLNWNSEV
jgi:hypothetical protein